MQCLLSESIDVKIEELYQLATNPRSRRLTKYQLMLKDLVATCGPRHSGRVELQVKQVAEHKSPERAFSLRCLCAFVDPFYVQECLDSVLRVIRSVNDSLHQVNILHLPALLQPLGSLICQVRDS